MIVYGIIESLSESRLLILYTRQKTYHIKLQRSLYLRYKPLLLKHQRVVAFMRKEKSHWKIDRFLKVLTPNGAMLNPLFHQNQVLSEAKALINAMDYKLFIDFEMSMHPYYYSPSFVSEIIQVGWVLTDPKGEEVETFKTYVKPALFPTLTERTLKFLSVRQKEIDKGISFHTLYERFEKLLETYHPAIFTWGSNDESMFKDTLKRHHLKLHPELRFIDLLKLHKHVYMYKNDLGLQKAYEMYGNHSQTPQQHDALDDAIMTKEIFKGFKAYLNGPKPVLASYYLHS